MTAPSAATDVDNFDQTVALSNTLMLSSRTVLETRAQLAASDFTAPPVDLVGPAVSIAGVASFGTSSGNPAARRNTLYQVVNNLSHQTGSHALRLGVDFIYNDDRITYPARLPRQLRLLVAGEFSRRRLQQRRLHADLRRIRRLTDQSEPRAARPGRVEARPRASR